MPSRFGAARGSDSQCDHSRRRQRRRVSGSPRCRRCDLRGPMAWAPFPTSAMSAPCLWRSATSGQSLGTTSVSRSSSRSSQETSTTSQTEPPVWPGSGTAALIHYLIERDCASARMKTIPGAVIRPPNRLVARYTIHEPLPITLKYTRALKGCYANLRPSSTAERDTAIEHGKVFFLVCLVWRLSETWPHRGQFLG